MPSSTDNIKLESLQTEITSIDLNESVRALKLTNFLSREDRNALYRAVCDNQLAFEPPAPGVQNSLYLPLDASSDEREGIEPIRQASARLVTRIRQQIPDLCRMLDIETFVPSEIPLTLVNGLDGHCGLPHADSLDGRFQISLLYYFHREPKIFRGGDLELYETDPAASQGFLRPAFTCIEQQDNTLIAFPSDTFHGITEVRCASTDFSDGRFAGVSFLGT